MVQDPFCIVFTSPIQLGGRNIAVTDEEMAAIVVKVYHPYLQSVNWPYHWEDEVYWAHFFNVCVWHRQLHSKEEELSKYGMEKMNSHEVLQDCAKGPTQSNKRCVTTWHWPRRNRIGVESFQASYFCEAQWQLLATSPLTIAIGSNDITTCGKVMF